MACMPGQDAMYASLLYTHICLKQAQRQAYWQGANIGLVSTANVLQGVS